MSFRTKIRGGQRIGAMATLEHNALAQLGRFKMTESKQEVARRRGTECIPDRWIVSAESQG